MTHSRLLVLMLGSDSPTPEEKSFLKRYTEGKKGLLVYAQRRSPEAFRGSADQQLAALAYEVYDSAVDVFY